MKTTRQAVLCVSRELLEQLLSDWKMVALLRFGDLVDSSFSIVEKFAKLAKPYHTSLKLPANCCITGISHTYRFQYDQVAFRIECPDFVETQEACMLPEVQAVYQGSLYWNNGPNTGYFLRWGGPAVEMRREYGPDGNVIKVGPPVVNIRAVFDDTVVWDGLPTYKGLSLHFTEGVSPCWKCHNLTIRRLPDGVAECPECAGSPLL